MTYRDRVLVSGGERFSRGGWERLRAGLVAGDAGDEVLQARLTRGAPA